MLPMFADARSEMHDLLRKRRQRSPWDLATVIGGGVWPPLLYACVYYLAAFDYRIYHPWLATAFWCVNVAVCVGLTGHAAKRYKLSYRAREAICLALTMWVALFAGTAMGDRTFWWDSWSYFSFRDLASYTDIDPSADKGGAYMDAGQVYFKEGTIVSKDKAMAFQNHGVYCVAPIVRQTLDNSAGYQTYGTGAYHAPVSGTVDWWAVGKDCCDPASGKNFTCGDVGNARARAAIRMLDEEARLFYLMAVQEWSAWLHLPSRHPLFFHWVQDPLLEVDRFYYRASKRFFANVVVFITFSVFLTLAVLWGLARIGIM